MSTTILTKSETQRAARVTQDPRRGTHRRSRPSARRQRAELVVVEERPLAHFTTNACRCETAHAITHTDADGDLVCVRCGRQVAPHALWPAMPGTGSAA